MKVDLNHLKRNIEWLRQKMIHTANVKGSFIDPEVIEVSRKLDVLIIDYQRLKLYIGE